MQCRRVSQGCFVLGVFVLVPTLLLAQVRQSNFRPQGSLGGGASAATDPGPRGGAAGAGGAYDGLTSAELAAFNAAMTAFMETDSVTGSIAGETGAGLGPTFNGNSCAQCHAEPATGGSSPGSHSPQHPVPNPQIALATLDGAKNSVPSFITADGPMREARFVRNPNGTADGGVHALFTVTGRTDAAGCTLAQPGFAQALAQHNVIFRIPTPTFGLGLVEATPDSPLQANLAANQSAKAALGIRGTINTSGNDGTITRFGWKAQNKSLLIFAGEAYNVEMGVSNEAFPSQRSAVPGCVFNGSMEDGTNLDGTGAEADTFSDVVNFAIFMRFLAPPTPGPSSPSTQNGAAVFSKIGCD